MRDMVVGSPAIIGSFMSDVQRIHPCRFFERHLNDGDRDGLNESKVQNSFLEKYAS